ncbi:GNAT family N-acetyltransferase [Pikeienuella piscinae]|nr:N-acetyltransferase [Pikeienuella piscinae]
MEIRDFDANDAGAIRTLLRAAFPGPQEADLVEAIRRDGDAVIELVAGKVDAMAGALLLSRMRAPFRALGLGPLAVAEGARGRGLGAALVRSGAGRARAQGWEALFVLGEPDYYRRFGFDVAAAACYESPYAGPYLMMLTLTERALPKSGPIAYAPAFAALES